jgi:hypothetical protein
VRHDSLRKAQGPSQRNGVKDGEKTWAASFMDASRPSSSFQTGEGSGGALGYCILELELEYNAARWRADRGRWRMRAECERASERRTRARSARSARRAAAQPRPACVLWPSRRAENEQGAHHSCMSTSRESVPSREPCAYEP